MTYKNINWDATAFFASLIETNKFAKAHDFVFAKVSGLDGFEEALQQLQSATAIIAVSDISQGYIEVNNSPHGQGVTWDYGANVQCRLHRGVSFAHAIF